MSTTSAPPGAPPPDQDAAHLHEKFRYVLRLSDRDRIAFLDESRWIGYERAQFILDHLVGLMNKPKKPRMPNLLIVGESNNGKTTLIERFLQRCGEGYVDDESESIRPVIFAQAPPTADEKGLYLSILSQFWAPYKKNGTVPELRYDVINKLRLCKAKLLIIDELHSLLIGPPVKQRQVMNAIKLICNELRIPVVGVGTRDAVRVLYTDPQHASRFDTVSLPLWELNHDFEKLLAGFERVLPLKKPSNLSDPQLATALYGVCEGNLGDLHRLLTECTRDAIESGKECIDLKSVESKSWVKPTKGIRELGP